MPETPLKIALVGNPNSGKSTLFNHLTGLNQKIGNFPGVTVDRKEGQVRLLDNSKVSLLDLPGTYSLHPRSLDEEVVRNLLLDPSDKNYPDLLIYLLDTSNFERSLLLYSQVHDLSFPVILAANMMDQSTKNGLMIDLEHLEKLLAQKVVAVDGRNGDGVLALKREIQNFKKDEKQVRKTLIQPDSIGFISTTDNNWYSNFMIGIQKSSDPDSERNRKLKYKEIFERYKVIAQFAKKVVAKEEVKTTRITGLDKRIDRYVNHPIYGYLIFMIILFAMFQSVFAWSEPLMDMIDLGFSRLSNWFGSSLPSGIVTDLLANGIIPGLGGVVIFIPQIAVLFLFIGVLEETGYMSRAVFLMDRIMVRFGLNGKSVVPLISGMACAIPAVMATRTIDNWRDRLITIMVTPLMSCSARLPVYAIIIAMIIPETMVFGFLNLQGLVLTFLYLIGFVSALLSAWVFKKIIKTNEGSFFLMELPTYRLPRLKNLGLTVLGKSRTFVLSAGKIIVAISIVLWFLATYGPEEQMEKAREVITMEVGRESPDYETKLSAYKLEHSFAGYLGKLIEPAIAPLGFDWKMGIGLITSFAAREVFVGTLATIYSIGDADDTLTIKEKLMAEVDPETGEKVYNFASGMSILIFYVFAMQCMSTLAVVKRETKSWKWPLIQLTYMSFLAYVSSLIVYQVLI